MLPILLAFILINPSQGGTIPLIEVTVTPNHVGTLEGEYSFTLKNLPNFLPDDGTISITFPETFTVPSSLNIIAFQGLGSKSLPVVTITANTLSISNGAPYSQSQISFLLFQGNSALSSIVPLTNQTGFVQVSTRSASNVVIDSNAAVSVSIIPRNLNGMTIQSSNPLTSSASSMIINLSLPFILTHQASILITFPILNPQAPANLQKSLLYRLQYCFKMLNNQHKRFPCEMISANQLLVRDLFTSDSDSQIALKIADIQNPYALTPTSQFEVVIFSRFGGVVAQKTDCVLSATQPSKPKAISITSSNQEINQPTNFLVEIFPLSYFTADDTIELYFPEVIDLSSFGGSLQVEGVKGMSNNLAGLDIMNNALILPQSIEAYTEDSIIFRVSGVSNVGYFVKDAPFEIRMKDTSNNLICQQSTNIFYETAPLPMSSTNLQVSTHEINKKADYTFSFTLGSTLSDGTISIEFPLDFPQFDENVVCKDFQNVNSNANCFIEGRIIKILDVFPLDSGTDPILFTVGEITNPSRSRKIGSFVIQTTNQENRVLHSFNDSFDIVFLPGELTLTNFGLISDEVRGPVGISLAFSTSNSILKDSTIEILLNENLIIHTEQFSCSLKLPTIDETQARYYSNKLKIIMIEYPNDEDLEAGAELQIKINGLKNLRVTEPECLFTMRINSKEGYSVDEIVLTTCQSLQEIPKIGKIGFVPLVPKQGLKSNYVLKFNTPFHLQEDDILRITFPQNFPLPSNSIEIFSNGNSLSYEISATNNQLIFSLSKNYATSEEISLSITNLINPTLQTQHTFQISLQTNEGVVLAEQAFGIELSKDQVLPLEKFNLTFPSLRVGETITPKLTFQNQRQIDSTEQIQIRFPQTFQLLSEECEITNLPSNFECQKLASNLLVLQKFESPLSPQDYTIQLPEIRNSLTNNYSKIANTFSFNILNSQNQITSFATYLLEENFECEAGCLYCQNSYNECIQCESDKLLLNKACVSECPDRFFAREGKCLACEVSDCRVCSDKTSCSQCDSGFRLADGVCEVETLTFRLTESNFIISYCFAIALILTIGKKLKYRHSYLFSDFASLLSLTIPAFLIWTLVKLSKTTNQASDLLLFGSIFSAFLLLQMCTGRLFKGIKVNKSTGQNKRRFLSNLKNWLYLLTLKYYNFKVSLSLYQTSFNSKSLVIPESTRKSLLSFFQFSLLLDSMLMFVISGFGLFSLLLLENKKVLLFSFIIQLVVYTFILGSLELYLFLSTKKEGFYLDEGVSLHSELHKSSINMLKEPSLKEKSSSEFSVFNADTLRSKINNPQDDNTPIEISFRDVKTVTPTKSKEPRYRHSRILAQKVPQFFSEKFDKTLNKENVENISFFSEKNRTDRDNSF